MGQRSRSVSLRPHRPPDTKPAGIEYGLFAHAEGRSAWGLFARQRLRSKAGSHVPAETHVYSLNDGAVSVSLAVPASDAIPGTKTSSHQDHNDDDEHEVAHKLYRSTLEIRISPAEEALARYILDNAASLAPAGSRTLELGAGHFGFVGLTVAVATEAACVHLTDGSSSAVADLERQVSLNRHRWGCCEVVSKVLQWEQSAVDTAEDLFELVVGADIVYRDGAHRSLLSTISRFLSRHGVAVLCASFQNHQLETFLNLARSQFVTTVSTWEDGEGMLQKLVRIRGVERAPVTLITLRHIPPVPKKPKRPPPQQKNYRRIPKCAVVKKWLSNIDNQIEPEEASTKTETKRTISKPPNPRSPPLWREEVEESPPPTPKGCLGTRWWVTQSTDKVPRSMSLMGPRSVGVQENTHATERVPLSLSCMSRHSVSVQEREPLSISLVGPSLLRSLK